MKPLDKEERKVRDQFAMVILPELISAVNKPELSKIMRNKGVTFEQVMPTLCTQAYELADYAIAARRESSDES